MADIHFSGFIEPDSTLRGLPFDELHKHLSIPIYSGHRAHFGLYTQDDESFGDLVARIAIHDGYEDQCSAKYYYDMYSVMTEAADQVDRILEVGVYMGGASVILAGIIERGAQELVLIDINDRYLQVSYERLIRSFPSVAERVRLFHGDLPTYVRDVLIPEPSAKRLMLQLDGAHSFEAVVRDVGSLSFVQDRLHGIMAQDTHLRGMPSGMRFVDAALFSVFGGDFQFVAMGTEYARFQADMMNPNEYGGNYFLPGKPEGMYLPMSHNSFEYPHPSMKIDDLFWAS